MYTYRTRIQLSYWFSNECCFYYNSGECYVLHCIMKPESMTMSIVQVRPNLHRSSQKVHVTYTFNVSKSSLLSQYSAYKPFLIHLYCSSKIRYPFVCSPRFVCTVCSAMYSYRILLYKFLIRECLARMCVSFSI